MGGIVGLRDGSTGVDSRRNGPLTPQPAPSSLRSPPRFGRGEGGVGRLDKGARLSSLFAPCRTIPQPMKRRSISSGRLSRVRGRGARALAFRSIPQVADGVDVDRVLLAATEGQDDRQ